MSSTFKFRSAVVDETSKMPQPIGDQDGHLCKRISTQNTDLLKDVEYLLPLTIRKIPFSGCRGEVEMPQATRGQGGHLY